MDNRNTAIDVAKGIGIILVVLGHNWVTLHKQGELFRVIFSFHMPLFFFLSGIFIREHAQLKGFVIARADSLLKPYFAVLAILGCTKIVTEMVAAHAVPTINLNVFASMLYGTGSAIYWGTNTFQWIPLWFLPHLFLASSFVLLVQKLCTSSRLRAAYIIFTLMVGVYFLGYFWRQEPVRFGPLEMPALPGLPFSADLLPITSAFIMMGSLFTKHAQAMKFNLPLFIGSMFIFACLHYFFDETIDINLRTYGNLFISTLQAILGIYLILSISLLTQAYTSIQKILAYIGSGTLFILLFHMYFQSSAFPVLSKLAGNSFFPIAGSLISGIVLPLILWEIVKRNYALAKIFLPNGHGKRHS